MYLSYFETYLNLVQTGNFHKTAKQLGFAQSTVSQHIRKLEEYLGVELIIRKNSGCEQTSAAKRLDYFAQGIHDLLERARDSLKNDRLIVGASSNVITYLLQPDLRKYLHSQTSDFDFSLTIDRNDLIIEKLENWKIDLAITEWWVSREGFKAQLWRKEPLVIIVPEKHSFAARAMLEAKDLIGESILGGEVATGTGRILKNSLGEVANQLKIKMNLGNTAAVIEGVRNGLGISIVLQSAVAKKEQQRGLKICKIKNVPLMKSIYLIHRDNLVDTHPALRLVNDLMLSA